jgi:hypothetical protein
MDTAKIPCRRCLFEGVDKEKIMAMIEGYLEALPEEEKTPENIYQERLSVCEPCSRLENGLCVMCGCFVLYRAGRTTSECPCGKWGKV